uniref:Rapamycin-insensitive companion of mTOR domain-containing protein n=1 Tax=Acrobeloides nanus TaxID=290746 RepID=A0A914DDY9_9BILA
MGLLFRQLADESPKVVRHAVRLLNTWIPKYPQSLKYVKNVRVESLGEAGIFIQTHLFEDEYHVSENQSATLKAIQLWMESFNFRYVETVEENMRLALLNVRRSLSGRFARSSSEKYERYGVPAPVHLLANLAKHATGRQILLKTQVVQQLLTTLKNSTIQPENYSRIKAALFGLAHIAGNMPMEHDSRLMPAETIPIICRFAEECPVLSIRGTAFWAMNIIAGSEFGARAIASMGWEGNRHANVLDEVRSRLENLNTNNISVKETSTIRSLKNPIVANKCTSSESSSSPVRTHQMLGRIHSDSMVPLPQIKELKKATIEICLENLVRPERTFTQESAVTSGFGSAPTEEEAAIPNKEAQQPLLPTVFPNRINAQINPMTTGTPVKLDELDNFSNTSDQTVLRYEVSFKDTGRIIMDKVYFYTFFQSKKSWVPD